MQHNATFKHIWTFEAYGPDGTPKWAKTVRNAIVTAGLDDILNQYWKGAGYTASHFVGLTGAAPTVAPGDTMAAHPGWTEVAAYGEATRRLLTLGDVAAQSVDNSAAKAVFNINANGTTMGGAFIVTDSTKGGSAGVLVAVAAFSGGNKTLDAGDLLNVTVTLTAANSA